MSIPKVIHYCWFGNNPLPEDAKKCIDSWKKYCPDYEIRQWDESNFDVSQHIYMKEAYESKKWAFVTDIARLIIVYQYGGIYMDTDVELIKPLDSLLNYSAYMGYEKKRIATGLGFGAEKGNPIVKKLLDDYDGIHFINEDGIPDDTPCPTRNTKVLKELGLRCDGSEQMIGNIRFLSEEYLCPMDWRSQEMTNLTENTLSIHHYTASWKKWYDREKYMNKAGLKGTDRIKYYVGKIIRAAMKIRSCIAQKKIALNLIFSMISFAMNLGISFFLTPFIIEKISSEAYGFYGLAYNFTGYVGIFTAALNSMAGRFITVSLSRGKKQDAEKYISSVFIANVILAIPLSIIGALIIINLDSILQVPETLLPSVQILWTLIFIDFIFSLVCSVFSTATFAKNRLYLSSLIKTLTGLIGQAILVTAFLCFRPLIWYFGLSSLVTTVLSAIAAYRIFRKLLPGIRIRYQNFEFEKIRTLIASGIWNSISQLSSVLLEELDLLITNLFVSSGAMGLVSVAKSIPTKMLSFFVLFGNAFSAQITIDYAKGDYDSLKKNILSAIRLVSFCSSVPLTFIYILGEDFFRLWVPTQNARLLYIIAILACLEFPLAVPTAPLWQVFTAANKTRQTAFLAIITATISVTSTFGLLSIADTDFQKMCIIVGVSSCLGIFRGAVFLPLYGAHCAHLKWHAFYPVLGKNLLGLAIGSVAAFALKQMIVPDSWSKLLMLVLILGIVMTVINAYLLLTPRERQILINKIKKIRNRGVL